MNTSLTIEEWIAALRGAPQSAEHASYADVKALRAIIAESAARNTRPVTDDMRQRFHAYLRKQSSQWTDRSADAHSAKARRNAPAVRPLAVFWQRVSEWVVPKQSLLAFVALVMVAVLVMPWVYDASEPTDADDGVVMRGNEQPQKMVADDPEARADEIVAILAKQGIRAYRTKTERVVVLQAMVPPTDQATRGALKQVGVIVPDHGRLNLVLKRK